MKRIAFAASVAVLLATPLAAQAQTTSTITLTGNVDEACVLGDPDTTELDLGILTGPDGRLDSSLVSSAVSASTVIPVAWCNAPSVMTLDASPLSLVTPPAYATPAGFSRLITYTANLAGWIDALSDRPTIGDSGSSRPASSAHAADPLEIEISELATLDAAGTTEASAFLEAGAYSGTIVIGLTVQP